MGLGILLAAHICCTTLGLGGLVSANGTLAAVAANAHGDAFRRGVGYSLALNRVFGPLLGIGILIGFALMAAAGIAASSRWLLIAYALVVAGIAFQASVAVPWQRRALAADPDDAAIDRRTPLLAAGIFALDFVAIVFVMVLKP